MTPQENIARLAKVLYEKDCYWHECYTDNSLGDRFEYLAKAIWEHLEVDEGKLHKLLYDNDFIAMRDERAKLISQVISTNKDIIRVKGQDEST